MLTQVHEIIRHWRAEAERARSRQHNESFAHGLEAAAADMEALLLELGGRSGSLKECAAISGYSVPNLRRRMDSAQIENVGRAGAPRLRIADLPFKAGKLHRLLAGEEGGVPERKQTDIGFGKPQTGRTEVPAAPPSLVTRRALSPADMP